MYHIKYQRQDADKASVHPLPFALSSDPDIRVVELATATTAGFDLSFFGFLISLFDFI